MLYIAVVNDELTEIDQRWTCSNDVDMLEIRFASFSKPITYR